MDEQVNIQVFVDRTKYMLPVVTSFVVAYQPEPWPIDLLSFVRNAVIAEVKLNPEITRMSIPFKPPVSVAIGYTEAESTVSEQT